MSKPKFFDTIVITCEHGGYAVPAAYRPMVATRHGLIATHRGYDKGALPVARQLATGLKAPLFFGTVTRLVIDLNRTAGDLPEALLQRWYWPYRRGVEAAIAKRIKRGLRVLHLSVHSFTPVKNAVVRTADIGLLYDPKRPLEIAICKAWQPLLAAHGYRVRRNYPYVGWTDGFTTYLRTRFAAGQYAGIEIEMNQKLARDAKSLKRYAQAMMTTITELSH